MVYFEWKKMWKSGMIVILILFSAFRSYYTLSKDLMDPPNMRYPQVSLMDHPNSSAAQDVYRYMTYQGLIDNPVSKGFENDWKKHWDLQAENEKRYKELKKLGNDAPREERLRYEKEELRIYEHYEAFLRKYDLKFSRESHEGLRWVLFELRHAAERQAYSVTSSAAKLTNNAFRLLLMSSSELFGSAFIVFLLFLCAGISSKEWENGTILFMRTQPMERWKILHAKFISVLGLCLLYMFATIFFFFLFAYGKGIPLFGGEEIFRVFARDNLFSFVTVGDLFLMVILAFFSMAIFYSALLIFGDERLSSTSRTMAVFLLSFLAFQLLTREFSSLNRSWNPIFALDYVQVLIGKLEMAGASEGRLVYETRYAQGFLPYLMYSMAGMGFFFLAARQRRSRPSAPVRRCQTKPVSPMVFEMKKIIQSKGFLFLFAGEVVIAVVLWVILFRRNTLLKEVHLDPGQRLWIIESFVREAEENLSVERKKGRAEEELDFFKNEIVEEKQALEEYRMRLKAFYRGWGDRYYPIMLHEMSDMLGSEDSNPKLVVNGSLKSGYFSDATYYETRAVLKQAEKEDLEPLIIEYGIFPSAYEEYLNPVKKDQTGESYRVFSNSAVFSLYHLFSRKRLDLLFLLVFSLMALSGYTLDKEFGRQIELMYTEPISRMKYHLIKIVAPLLVAFGALAVLVVSIFLLGLLSEGIGEFRFPVVCHHRLVKDPGALFPEEVSESIRLVALWRVLLRSFGILLIQCFFLSSLFQMISLFVREKMKLMIVAGSVLGLGYLCSEHLLTGDARCLSPFFYFSAGSVADASVMVLHRLPGFTISLGVVSLCWGGLLFTLSGICFAEAAQS